MSMIAVGMTHILPMLHSIAVTLDSKNNRDLDPNAEHAKGSNACWFFSL